MNILYIDHYAGSLSMGMEFRPYYLAREWQKMGHKVRIIGANYSHLRKHNPVVNKDFEIQEMDGIEFQWIKTSQYCSNGVSRAISMFQFCVKLWHCAKKIAKDFNPELVISSSTYPLDTYPAQRIAKKSNSQYVHEAHDIWPLTLIEIGGMSKYHPFCVLMGFAERSAYRNSKKVVSVSPNTVDHMIEVGLQSRNKFQFIPNGIVFSDWEKQIPLEQECDEFFKKLKAENKFIVLYLGGHALSNSLDTLLNAAKLLDKKDNIEIVLVGKGVEKERLMQRVHDENISNVTFLPPVDKLQVPSILSEADVLYVGAAKSELYKMGMALNKVYDYMMAGKPIIYAVDGLNNEIDLANCGYTIEPENPVALKETILMFAHKDKDELMCIGQNGRHYVLNNREYTELAKQFLGEIMK